MLAEFRCAWYDGKSMRREFCWIKSALWKNDSKESLIYQDHNVLLDLKLNE